MFKWLGVILTIGATSGTGFWLGARLSERCRLLKDWMAILEVLKSAIGYQELLPEIFRRLAVCCKESGFAPVFENMAEQIRFGSEHGVAEIWNQMLDRAEFTDLQSSDKETLRELGFFLGSTDRMDQAAKINLCQEKLKLNLIRAEDSCSKRIGLYRYLGFATGALLVLWFI